MVRLAVLSASAFPSYVLTMPPTAVSPSKLQGSSTDLTVRQADNVTVFPDGITVGATFDKRLMYERGVAIGEEVRSIDHEPIC